MCCETSFFMIAPVLQPDMLSCCGSEIWNLSNPEGKFHADANTGVRRDIMGKTDD